MPLSKMGTLIFKNRKYNKLCIKEIWSRMVYYKPIYFLSKVSFL